VQRSSSLTMIPDGGSHLHASVAHPGGDWEFGLGHKAGLTCEQEKCLLLPVSNP
jgi:hypothetical protein